MADAVLAEWAANEFGRAELGDARRTARLVALAEALGANPTASLPEACSERAALKAAYRFFATGAVTPAAILVSHVQATYVRLAAVPLVLAAQDTTLLDWTAHAATTGLGPLGSAQRQGLLVHSTLALTPDRVPLGLLAQEVWARDAATYGQLPDQHARVLADKESQKWLTSLTAVCAARTACPQTRFVSVGDREADVYDLFAAPRPVGVDLLVRATQDRCLADADHRRLHAAVAAAPVAATATLRLPRRATQPARQATLAVRWRMVTLRPPARRASEALPCATVWAVWAVEEAAPPGHEPVAWLLLTTVPVITTDDALDRLAWYACRWGIEVWHKVLKSGCRLEARQLATADRLQRCLALYSVIAWRILWATMLARTLPDAPCTVLLDEDEWQALFCTIHHTPTPPTAPPPLREAVRWLAQLGGFLGRTRDGDPGVTVLWRGFQHLADLTTMYRIMRPPPALKCG